MSLYNLIHGVNRFAPILMNVLGLSPEDIGRFRDCFISEDGKYIVVYTRNGGGNRMCWVDADEEMKPDCSCVGCFMNYRVQNLPGYSHDRDDTFDSTYASIYFNIPDVVKDTIGEIMSLGGTGNPERKFQEMIKKLEAGDMSDPAVRRTVNALKPVIDRISKIDCEHVKKSNDERQND